MSNRLAAIADDLSGAAEVAAVLGTGRSPSPSRSRRARARRSVPSDVVLDCDTRSLDPDARRAPSRRRRSGCAQPERRCGW